MFSRLPMRAKDKIYVIAEIGINHDGCLQNAYKLIDAAVDAGCDCVKFQFFKAKNLYPRSAGRLDWKDAKKRYSYDIYNAVRSFELPSAWISKLKKYCRRKDIDFLSSVFDRKNANYLVRQGIKMIKLPSYAITNTSLIECCAQYRLPIFMSTGGATLGEVEEAVEMVNKYHNNLYLLHCSIKYPTKLSECNLGVIETLRHAFPRNLIGYSDHTEEVSRAAVAAVYLGARIIEKHITLNKTLGGPDHFFALEPHELKKMTNTVRKAQRHIKRGDIRIDKKLYGSSNKIVFEHEKYLRNFCFASIFAKKNIRKGSRICYRDLHLLRSGKKRSGLEPKYLDMFKRYRIYAARDIKNEEVINWEKIFNA